MPAERVTLDRIGANWLAASIEQYLTWLHDHGYAARIVLRRVRILYQFGNFAHARGATGLHDCGQHLEAFVQQWVAQHSAGCKAEAAKRKSSAGGPHPGHAAHPSRSDGCGAGAAPVEPVPIPR